MSTFVLGAVLAECALIAVYVGYVLYVINKRVKYVPEEKLSEEYWDLLITKMYQDPMSANLNKDNGIDLSKYKIIKGE